MALKIPTFDPMMLWSSCRDFRTSTGRRAPLLHGEVGDVGISGDLELEDALGGGGVPVEHGAVHRGEGVAGHDGGLDGEFLDVRFGLLQKGNVKAGLLPNQRLNITWILFQKTWHDFKRPRCAQWKVIFDQPTYLIPRKPEFPHGYNKQTEADESHELCRFYGTAARLADLLCVTPRARKFGMTEYPSKELQLGHAFQITNNNI